MSRMPRHTSLFACALALVWLAGCTPDAPRNVLLITIDTLRADHLGAYGFSYDISPNIDRLAERGVVFERAIAASAATAPSHASIMTSRYPRHHSIGYANGLTTLIGGETLAELFARNGYETAAFIGNPILQRPSGLARGFQSFDGELQTPEGNRSGYLERRAQATTERALRWLASQPDDPVFLWVHYQDPHGPYTPPGSLRNLPGASGEASEPLLPVLEDDSGLEGIPAYQALPGLFRSADYRARYAGEIRYSDDWLGRLIDAFEARRSPGESIALLTSDHGESLGEEGRYFVHGYSTAPDNSHIPLILVAPGLAPGRSRWLASHVDIMPTLAELAGLPVEGANFEGVALGPVLRGESPPPSERFVYCDMGNEVSAYRDDHFLRIRDAGGAWARGTRHPDDIPSPPSLRHAWRPGESWSPTTGPEQLDESVRAYVLDAEKMSYLWELPPERQATLRAMGYSSE
jgi:arylsulfatase A-like enzyme